jgi:tRNA isopentenyl-2-thiomethyl-A-37 hydroxylase MiaE
MAETFHYPPHVFDLLVETIARLNRAKKGVVLFLRGAGVADDDLAEVDSIVKLNPESINKFEIVRNVLTKVNARADSVQGAKLSSALSNLKTLKLAGLKIS